MKKILFVHVSVFVLIILTGSCEKTEYPELDLPEPPVWPVFEGSYAGILTIAYLDTSSGISPFMDSTFIEFQDNTFQCYQKSSFIPVNSGGPFEVTDVIYFDFSGYTISLIDSRLIPSDEYAYVLTDTTLKMSKYSPYDEGYYEYNLVKQ